MADLCTNPGFETDTTGWFTASGTETLTRVTSEAHSGTASGQVVTPGGANQEGAFFAATHSLSVGESLTARAWVKGTGAVKVWASTVDGIYVDVFKSAEMILSSTWQQIQASGLVTGAATEVRIELRTSDDTGAQAVTFYIDDAELLVPDAAGSVTLPLQPLSSGLRW